MMMKLACLPAAAAAALALALAVVVFLSDSASANMTTAKTTKPWVRGVNIGGWLVMERFITPYFFAITTCHLRGDFCFYPGQVDAPPLDSPDYQVCDLFHCKPVQFMSSSGELDYPIDMYTLLTAFHDKHIAKRWLEFHWEHFVTKDDIRTLHEAGVTHVRVPVPHWILEDSATIGDEPWVEGGWLYFIRLVSWCREFNIQVWPDIHTAPGSQNGFDNSGHALPNPTCTNWQNDPNNVNRTLKAVQDISQAIVDDGLSDVVTGFGTLNEPFVDCSDVIVRDYNERALAILRKNMGPATSVYVGDIFNSTRFADGWWTDEKYENTFLDSHYYHVFAERPRALSPRQHIAYVCQKNTREADACCWNDPKNKTIPSKGISRVFGEWSASFDTLVISMLDVVMKGIARNGTAPFLDRTISNRRKEFLSNFVQAQMVTYEAADLGISRGWFYWTFKTEGGAFAEWNFMRGIREGWIPRIPDPSVASVDLYGICENIIFRTNDSMDIVHEFPDPTSGDKNNWQGVKIDDDVVISHGNSLLKGKTADEKSDDAKARAKATPAPIPSTEEQMTDDVSTSEDDALSNVVVNSNVDNAGDVAKKGGMALIPFLFVSFLVYGVNRVFFTGNPLDRAGRQGYVQVGPLQV